MKEPYTLDGNHVYFGEYPQTVKGEGVTVTAATDSRGYFLGSDGCYYAKVVASPFGKYTFSTGAPIENDEVYYFKVEPIRWRLLLQEGDEMLLLCDRILVNRCFDSDSNHYASSEIREWINHAFADAAFDEQQKGILLPSHVANDVNTTGYSTNPYVCEDTEDRVFLLSLSEVTQSAWGLERAADRQQKTTDYSLATGVWAQEGNGWWWLRSPYNEDREFARHVNEDGNVRDINGINYSNCVSAHSAGVVPALRIRRQSVVRFGGKMEQV